MFPQINGHFITSLPAPHEISPHQMRRFFNECVFLYQGLKFFGSRLTKIDFQMFNDLRFVENIDVSQNQVIFAKKRLLNSSLINLTLFLCDVTFKQKPCSQVLKLLYFIWTTMHNSAIISLLQLNHYLRLRLQIFLLCPFLKRQNSLELDVFPELSRGDAAIPNIDIWAIFPLLALGQYGLVARHTRITFGCSVVKNKHEHEKRATLQK